MSKIIKGISDHFKKLKIAEQKAEVAAVNRAGQSAYSATLKFLSSNYNVSQKNFKEYFKTRKASKGKAVFRIETPNTGLGLYINAGTVKLFGARQLKKGLKLSVKKGSSKVIPNAFIATMKSGHKGGFVRKSTVQSSTRPGNLTKHSQAIKEIYGLNVGGVFLGNLTQEELEGQFFNRFVKEFDKAWQYYLSKV